MTLESGKLTAMFEKLRAWRKDRRKRKLEKWANDHSWIPPAEMDKVQRNFGAGRRRAGSTRRRLGSRY